MQISTHIKPFLLSKLKLVTLVTWYGQFNFFLPNFDIFVTFSCYSTLPLYHLGSSSGLVSGVGGGCSGGECV